MTSRGGSSSGAGADAAFEAALRDASGKSGLALTDAQVAACGAHFRLLVTWNKTHNLTRITDPADAARKHYLDCLVPLLKVLPAPSAFVDIGSGAGFPGLMAALAWPEAQATLVEPAQKRASFLTLAAGAMGVKVTVASPPAKPGQGPRAPVVLSRATFSPGLRGELTGYAAGPSSGRSSGRSSGPSSGPSSGLSSGPGEGGACIVVWGHRHDTATWENEVSTWPGWRSDVLDYAVDGLEPRALLLATR